MISNVNIISVATDALSPSWNFCISAQAQHMVPSLPEVDKSESCKVFAADAECQRGSVRERNAFNLCLNLQKSRTTFLIEYFKRCNKKQFCIMMMACNKQNLIIAVSAYLIVVFLNKVNALKPDQVMSYDTAYDLGMDAYKHEKWSQCTKFFKSAIDNYHIHQNLVAECRLKCQPRNFSESQTLDEIFHELLLKGNCLRLCNKKTFGSKAEVEISAVIMKKFEDRMPYNYLHFCYFKVIL